MTLGAIVSIWGDSNKGQVRERETVSGSAGHALPLYLDLEVRSRSTREGNADKIK